MCACGENDPEPRRREEHICDHKKPNCPPRDYPAATERDYQDDDCIWMTPKEEEKRIRKHEREKVLDDILTWLCDCDGGDVVLNPKLGLYSSPQPFNTIGLIQKLGELRSKQGEQG